MTDLVSNLSLLLPMYVSREKCTYKRVAYLANTTALRTNNFSAARARQECDFVNTVRHEACDSFHQLGCRDSLLRQDPSFR